MDKQAFLAAIRQGISTLPPPDIEKSLAYYSEMIDDRMEDGINEEEAVAALEAPDAIAQQILLDTPLPKLVKAQVKPRHERTKGEMILLVLGSPIWVSLLLSAMAVAVALYSVCWAVLLSLYAVDLSLALAALAGLLQGGISVFAGSHMQAVFYLGAGIACFGLAVLLFFAFNKVTALLIRGSKQAVMHIKYAVVKKGAAQ